jgi:hypothetical protein
MIVDKECGCVKYFFGMLSRRLCFLSFSREKYGASIVLERNFRSHSGELLLPKNHHEDEIVPCI